eukprot:6562112-Pyramimonas_sp.AAC.1
MSGYVERQRRLWSRCQCGKCEWNDVLDRTNGRCTKCQREVPPFTPKKKKGGPRSRSSSPGRASFADEAEVWEIDPRERN